CLESDAAAGPFAGDGHLPLVPGPGDALQAKTLPARMAVQRLAIFLDVVVRSRPEARDLEKAPFVSGHRIGAFPGRLPAPQPVQATPLACGGFLAARFAEIPDNSDPGRESRFWLFIPRRRSLVSAHDQGRYG